MPVSHYSVCKGRLLDYAVRQPNRQKPPHLHLSLEHDGGKLDVAVNIQSADRSRIRYRINGTFTPPYPAQPLIDLPLGITGLPAGNDLRLDYIRQHIVEESQLADLPISDLGRSVLHGALGELAGRAKAERGALVLAFGSAYPNGSGLHETHMNQGNPDGPGRQHRFFLENGRYQDGALLFYFPAEQNPWSLVTIAFHSQVWDTDDRGNPLFVPERLRAEILSAEPAIAGPIALGFADAPAAEDTFAGEPELPSTTRIAYFFDRATSAEALARRRNSDPDFLNRAPHQGNYPYRKELRAFLHELGHEDRMQPIEAAGQLVFHCVGDTGDHSDRREGQDAVAIAMTNQVHGAALPDQPCFLFHLGDVVYPKGENRDYRDEFYNAYVDYPGLIFAIPGNHDSYEGDDPPLRPFEEHFCSATPLLSSRAGESLRRTMTQPNFYWTLRAPFVTIIGLYSNREGDLDHPNDRTTPQRNWLIKELAEAPQDARLIVAVHHPPYNLGKHSLSRRILRALNTAAEESGRTPDLVLAGHQHNYQHFERDWNGKKVPFLVAGNGGHVGMGSQGIDAEQRLPDDVKIVKSETVNPGFLRIVAKPNRIECEYFVVKDTQGSVKRLESIAVP